MAALISECGEYRYWLTRGEPGQRACFVMLNPSTADAETDDPTIKRCRSFAHSWGCSEILVLNLCAFRATDPRKLKTVPDPVGPLNARYWRELLPSADIVVCAWGGDAKGSHRDNFFTVADRLGLPLYCLGTTKSGEPRHPLYLKKDTALRRLARYTI